MQCGAAGSWQCFQAHQTLAARPALIPAFILSFISTCLQALQQVERFRSDHQEVLSERTATPTSQLKFITDAWMQARWRSRVHFALCLGAVVVLLCTCAHLCVQGRGMCRAGSLSTIDPLPPSRTHVHVPPPALSHRLQVVHCRRILKWTYSTAFYSFEEEAGAGKEARERLAQHQEFFEFNQVGCWWGWGARGQSAGLVDRAC